MMKALCRNRPLAMYCCITAALCCLLFAGGCASQQGKGRGGVSPSFSVPQADSSPPLSSGEMAALTSSGQLDRNIPGDGMADVARQYKYFLRQGRNTMSVFSKRAERYLSYSRKVFRSRGMPEELAYLAIVESGYRADAKSPAGAAGAWQFMPFTGEKFALSQDWWTDERLDPYEATEAAATYLQKLYNTFGDWSTAIAAYNAGEGKMGRARQGTGGRNFFEIKARNHMLDDKAQLREETKQYVPRFMAVSKIMRNLPQLGFDPIHPEDAQAIVRLTARPGTDLQGLAYACRMDWESFNALNRHHKRRATHSGRETYVYVPDGREREARDFLASPRSTVYAGWEPGKVCSNADSWDKLSRRCGVSVAQLRAVNPDCSRLRAGDTVLVPRSANMSVQAVAAVDRGSARDGRRAAQAAGCSSPTRAAAGSAVHTVQPGESLAGIARRYNISVRDLQEHNGIADARALRAGVALRVPRAKGAPAAEQRAAVGPNGRIGGVTPSRQARPGKARRTTYTVQANDSLWRIARAHNVSVEELKRWNGVDEKSLRVGARLVVEQ